MSEQDPTISPYEPEESRSLDEKNFTANQGIQEKGRESVTDPFAVIEGESSKEYEQRIAQDRFNRIAEIFADFSKYWDKGDKQNSKDVKFDIGNAVMFDRVEDTLTAMAMIVESWENKRQNRGKDLEEVHLPETLLDSGFHELTLHINSDKMKELIKRFANTETNRQGYRS